MFSGTVLSGISGRTGWRQVFNLPMMTKSLPADLDDRLATLTPDQALKNFVRGSLRRLNYQVSG
jgi:hypothetical protein